MTNYKGSGETKTWAFELSGTGPEIEGLKSSQSLDLCQIEGEAELRMRGMLWKSLCVGAALCVGGWLVRRR